MTWADCAGCADHDHDSDLHKGVPTRVAPFEQSTTELAQLMVHGKEEECRAYLEVGGVGLGGVPRPVVLRAAPHPPSPPNPSQSLGYGTGLCQLLKTDPVKGLRGGIEHAAEVAARHAAFGENRTAPPAFESWFAIFFDSFKELILIILIIAAIVSLIVGTIRDHDYGYVDGLAIMIAVFIVAAVTATNDYNKQLQFRALSDQSKARVEVQVLRDGVRVTVPTWDVLVGDLVYLETGCKVPADGVLLKSSELRVNESALTGETEDIKKDPLLRPMLLSGSQVSAGLGTYVVTAVGGRSMAGSIQNDLAVEDVNTPLQDKLEVLVKLIGYVGVACALGTFIAMMVIKAVGGATTHNWDEWTITSFIYAVTIIVVAIPEGLPLAVTISLAYSTRQMLTDQNLIRHLSACETMGGATDICSDKTGTLTENRMTVTEAWVGGSVVGYRNTEPVPVGGAATSSNWNATPSPLRALLRDHLALNSTAITFLTPKGAKEVKGSKTEGAGIMLVESFGASPLEIRASVEAEGAMVRQYTFSSERKMMSTLVKTPGGGHRLYTTGGSDFVLSRCTAVATLTPAHDSFSSTPLTPELSDSLVNEVIVAMAKRSLRTLGVAYRDYAPGEAVPAGDEVPEQGLTLYAVLGIKDPLRKDVGAAVAQCQAAGIKVRMVTGDNRITAEAIARECGILRDGSVVIEGPDFRALTPSSLDELLPLLAVMARSSPKDKNMLVRRLNGNLPRNREDWEAEHPDASWDTQRELLLPGYYDEWAAARRTTRGVVFKAVVGVTGDGTNDAPALKAADVGLSMGISGTQVAHDASDIIILDDNFSSIVKAVMWGRCVYDNVQKFLQFQLTVNVVALAITFLSAVSQKEPPLNPVMMLWVNLIMDTMGALALGTEKPKLELLQRRPYASTASLVLPRMWRHIFVQAAFQLTLLLVLLFKAASAFNITFEFLCDNNMLLHNIANGLTAPSLCGLPTPTDPVIAQEWADIKTEAIAIYVSTFIFNAFVFCQLFNELNARSLTNKWDVYSTVLENNLFCIIIIISALVQFVFVQYGKEFTQTSGLTGMHWLYTIALGAITLPLGVLQRFIPVPSRESDYADSFQQQFNKKMENRRLQAAGANKV